MKKNQLDIKERVELIESVAEEIVGFDELKSLLETDKPLICYDGMEPSGRLHIAQGILRSINTNKMIKAGFNFKIYIADWFAYLNNKLDGDLEKIQIAGKYFIEIWKSCGMNLENVEFIWASDLVKQEDYWELVMKIANKTTLNRILRCTQIMGRTEGEKLQASQILYPCMQAADIFLLGVNVAQLGMDQRKVNMLARKVADDLGYPKPVILSNHMLMGLLKPSGDIEDSVERSISMKMSKSKPDSAIFMDDSKEEVSRKILKAYCPEGVVESNPILEYCRYIIFQSNHLNGFEDVLKDGFLIKRPDKWGGDISYMNYDDLERDFIEKKLFPLDLKNAVSDFLNLLIEPVRVHLEEDKVAKGLLESVKSYSISR